jgi:hypothetical protein
MFQNTANNYILWFIINQATFLVSNFPQASFFSNSLDNIAYKDLRIRLFCDNHLITKYYYPILRFLYLSRSHLISNNSFSFYFKNFIRSYFYNIIFTSYNIFTFYFKFPKKIENINNKKSKHFLSDEICLGTYIKTKVVFFDNMTILSIKLFVFLFKERFE